MVEGDLGAAESSVRGKPGEKSPPSALVLIWAGIEQDRLKWRGIRMNDDLLEKAHQAVLTLTESPIEVPPARRYLDVA